MIVYYEFQKFCGKIITPHASFLQKIPIPYYFWGRIFLIINQFSTFLQHILGQTKCQVLQRNILPAVKLDRKYLRNTIIRD